MGGLSRRSTLVAVWSLLVTAAACGSPDDGTPEPPAGAAESTTTAVEPTTTPPPATTTDPPATTAAPSAATDPTTTLPGEQVDWLIAGTVAQVAGVAVGETFAIRTLPGDEQPVASSLPPLTELVLTGNGRDLDQGTFSITWAEVVADDVTGWISLWSLVYLGAPRDATAEAVAAFGELPTAPTMLELGAIVIDGLAPLDPDSAGAALVRATDPSAGATSDVVYDVFPGEEFGDDAAAGARYRVVGRQVPADPIPVTGFGSPLEYELVSVEVSSLCTRGVSLPAGVCV